MTCSVCRRRIADNVNWEKFEFIAISSTDGDLFHCTLPPTKHDRYHVNEFFSIRKSLTDIMLNLFDRIPYIYGLIDIFHCMFSNLNFVENMS